jgi:hypothetical protein
MQVVHDGHFEVKIKGHKRAPVVTDDKNNIKKSYNHHAPHCAASKRIANFISTDVGDIKRDILIIIHIGSTRQYITTVFGNRNIAHYSAASIHL